MDIIITFGRKDLEAMCLEKCKSVETFSPGHFDAHFTAYDGVKCTFIPQEEAEIAQAPIPVPSIANGVDF